MQPVSRIATFAVTFLWSISLAESFFYIPAPFYFPAEPMFHPSPFLPDSDEVWPFFGTPREFGPDVGDATFQLEQKYDLQSRHSKPHKSGTGGTIKGLAPLCIACSCLVGRKTCKAAGGVQVVTSDIITGRGPTGRVHCTPSAPCVLEPPAQLSACDPSCKLRDANCNPDNASERLNTCRNPLAATERLQCGTRCENLRVGAEVPCVAALQSRNVVSTRPPVCGLEHLRMEDRSLHKFKKLLLPKPLKLLALKAKLSHKVGPALFRYLPNDACLPKKLAGVPYCPAV